MSRDDPLLDEAKLLYAKLMTVASRSDDPRLERIFELVPREAFLPSGPWKIWMAGSRIETPSAHPIHLYQNVLVALDETKGINNGEPFLHAAWIGKVAPTKGDRICHIGAGTGYYTAILSMLALPSGHVEAFEIENDLATKARNHLKPFNGVTVIHGDATKHPISDCDLIYVNAGVTVPPASWFRALRPDGRIIMSWQPTGRDGLTVLIKRLSKGFSVEFLTRSWFISCVGASDVSDAILLPTWQEAQTIRSAWLTSDRHPDETAVAIFPDVWFSSGTLEAASKAA